MAPSGLWELGIELVLLADGDEKWDTKCELIRCDVGLRIPD
jgi:hypothetical protein